ncbi:uncharacterized protein AMSG_03776 [Thecamonas trahens ATCC 50062]|uniref:Serpin domain-containing protein n=1 Tax=Thecamonas trahens ATCC 50062 TaxID=461836 RepID=A0A0L0D4Q1_THETB|nr:hypothetical protein AMSG_03776 [Thecamonas trahens ATCC 50062]KNC47342.1 hypothetical protein AMSG_03776 [Thecamonas trahens ATCC 50062]|eukprot:XP_013759680.1 hypothetical protein AMSG_03776 [Thecamonas trahens ATCC 50062]
MAAEQAPSGDLGLDSIRPLGCLAPNLLMGMLMLTAAAGPGSETEAELKRVFRMENPGPQLQALVAAMDDAAAADPDVALSSSLAVFCRGELAQGFRSACGPRVACKAMPSSAAGINAWVRDASSGLITSIIDRIDSTHVAILLAVTALTAPWARPFDPELTTAASFATAPDASVPCAMMHAKRKSVGDDIGLVELRNCRGVTLPYGSGRFLGIFLLPGASEVEPPSASAALALADWLVGVDAGLSEVLAARRRRKVSVALAIPRFTVEATTGLVPILKELGVRTAFDFTTADLSALSVTPGIAVTNIIHKVVIKVDEAGTRAAAATATAVKSRKRVQLFTFTADRPFVFAVVDTVTTMVLFASAVLSAAQD